MSGAGTVDTISEWQTACTGCVQTGDVASGAIDHADLSNVLDNQHHNKPRYDHKYTTTQSSTTSTSPVDDTTLGSVTINAPTSGVVFIIYDGDAYESVSTADAYFDIKLDGAALGETQRQLRGNGGRVEFTAVAMRAVSAGSHTAVGRYWTDGATTIYARDRSIVMIFLEG